MKKNTKKNSQNQKIHADFSAGALTNFSGLKSIHRFVDKLELRKQLNNISIGMHHNIKYETGNILSVVIEGISCGMNRISKIENFTLDPLLQKFYNLKEKISSSTITNRLKRCGMKQCSEYMQVIGDNSRKVHKKLGTAEDILDLDSSVKTVYGNQQGAAKGFNEKKRGAKSYHPLLGFLNSTRECLLSWFRPGDTYTANGAGEFIKQAFSMIAENIDHLLVRADSGFFSDSMISEIEQRQNTDYLIKAKLKNLESVLSGQDWQMVPCMKGVEICDFEYSPKSWKKSRHFSAIRILREEIIDGVIFPIKVWDYFCYCTNIVDNPLQIHKLYGDRGTSENWIENVKNQMFAGQLLTDDFWANEMLWLSSIMAYNISVWMRKLTDNASWHEEPATFRSWFIQLAGKLIRTGRQIHLKMYEAYYYKERWRKIDEAVDILCF